MVDAVVCCLWWDPNHARKGIYEYGPEHVKRLERQVRGRGQLTDVPFICLSDRPIRGVQTIPISFAKFHSGTRLAKLTMFDPRGPLAGRRFAYMDLDCVVTGPLAPLFDRDEDLVLWRNPNYGQPGRARFNTSLILHTGGTRPEFFDEFTGIETLKMVQERTGWGGTDQAWISFRADRSETDGEAHWTDADGVYGAGRLKRRPVTHATDGSSVVGSPDVYTELPANARVVFTPGARTPWTPGFAEQHPWAVAFEDQ